MTDLYFGKGCGICWEVNLTLVCLCSLLAGYSHPSDSFCVQCQRSCGGSNSTEHADFFPPLLFSSGNEFKVGSVDSAHTQNTLHFTMGNDQA